MIEKMTKLAKIFGILLIPFSDVYPQKSDKSKTVRNSDILLEAVTFMKKLTCNVLK